jgi:hypothetical protein
MSNDLTTTNTDLQALVQQLATAEGAREALNGNGSKYWTRSGDLKRASRAQVSYHGVLLSIDYFANGFDEDAYVEQIKAVEVNHVDIMPLLSEEQIGELCERIEQGWVAV